MLARPMPMRDAALVPVCGRVSRSWLAAVCDATAALSRMVDLLLVVAALSCIVDLFG